MKKNCGAKIFDSNIVIKKIPKIQKKKFCHTKFPLKIVIKQFRLCL